MDNIFSLASGQAGTLYFMQSNKAKIVVWNLLCSSLGVEFEQPPTLQVAATSNAHFLVLAFCAVLVAPLVEDILLCEWLFGTLRRIPISGARHWRRRCFSPSCI